MRRLANAERLKRCYGPVLERLADSSVGEPAGQAGGLGPKTGMTRQVLITSSVRREGRTTSTIGLAAAAALLKPSRQILAIDLDFWRPKLAQRLGVKTPLGIREAIAGEAGVHDLLNPTVLPNLFVIGAGQRPVDMPESLVEDPLRHLLAECRSEFDLTVADSPALGEHEDARLLSDAFDTCLLVVRPKKCRATPLARAAHLLQHRSAGVLMNDFRNPVPRAIAARF